MRRRICVLGLCRNSAKSLPAILEMLGEIAREELFEIRVIFGENGSSDETRKILECASHEYPWLQILDTGFMAAIPERLARMAAGREFLRKSLPPRQANEAVMVIDTDLDLASPLTSRAIQAALEELDLPFTAGVCCHSLPVYYDILSLKENFDEDNIALKSYLSTYQKVGVISKTMRKFIFLVSNIRILSYQRRLGTGAGRTFISAFNGLCLYDRNTYDNYSYIGSCVECEHVTLNSTIHQTTGASIRVSRHLAVFAPKEHMSPIWQIWLGLLRQKFAHAPSQN